MEATLCAVDIYNRVPPTKPKKAGLRQTPFEKLHGEIPSLDELRPFGWGFVFNPVRGKPHKKRSEPVMFIGRSSSR